MTIKAPAALWSAAFVIAVYIAERIFGQGAAQEAIGTAAAGLVALAGWLLKAREEYERAQGEEDTYMHTMGREAVHRQDRETLQPAGFWRRFWMG